MCLFRMCVSFRMSDNLILRIFRSKVAFFVPFIYVSMQSLCLSLIFSSCVKDALLKKYIYIQTAWKQRAAHFAVKCWLYLGWFRCWTVKERGSEALGATRRRGCSPVSRHRALLLLTTSLQCALSLRLLRLGLSPTLSRSLFLSPRSTFVSLPLLFFSFNFVFRDKARVSIMKKYLVLV